MNRDLKFTEDLSTNTKIATEIYTIFSHPDHKPEEDHRFVDFEHSLSPEGEIVLIISL